MVDDIKKKNRKAKPGQRPRYVNLLRNWIHQGISYMDSGELFTRLFVELVEILLVYYFLKSLLPDYNLALHLCVSILIVHTWNWVTNCLFWALVIFAFPDMKNPGAEPTITYLNNMRDRLLQSQSITGVAIYGSVSRGIWHSRSDIDMRILRKRGLTSLLPSSLITMRERFIAFISKQPIDLFLADDVDFLLKMRNDEMPIMLVCRDDRLKTIYSNCVDRPLSINDLISKT